VPPMKSKKGPAARLGKGGSYHHGDLRAALLEAAEQELAERGLESFSLRGVAKRAGVSHAAPAHHFIDTNGLLTALATVGFERFVETQEAQQTRAKSDPVAQLVASGVGYVDFALQNSALFRLMFSSHRPSYENEQLRSAASRSFEKLVEEVNRVRDKKSDKDEDAMLDVTATWVTVHGIADLMIAGRSTYLSDLSKTEREAAIAILVERAVGFRAIYT